MHLSVHSQGSFPDRTINMLSARDLVVGEKYMLFEYQPKKVPAIIFIVLFGISSFLHMFQLIKKRTWYFIPFVIGGIRKSHSYQTLPEHEADILSKKLRQLVMLED